MLNEHNRPGEVLPASDTVSRDLPCWLGSFPLPSASASTGTPAHCRNRCRSSQRSAPPIQALPSRCSASPAALDARAWQRCSIAAAQQPWPWRAAAGSTWQRRCGSWRARAAPRLAQSGSSWARPWWVAQQEGQGDMECDAALGLHGIQKPASPSTDRHAPARPQPPSNRRFSIPPQH